jgi:hypothetical protein
VAGADATPRLATSISSAPVDCAAVANRDHVLSWSLGHVHSSCKYGFMVLCRMERARDTSIAVAARTGDSRLTYRKLADRQPRSMASHGISDGCERYL